MDMSLSKLWEMVKDRTTVVLESMGLQRVGHDGANEQRLGHYSIGSRTDLWGQNCPLV